MARRRYNNHLCREGERQEMNMRAICPGLVGSLSILISAACFGQECDSIGPDAYLGGIPAIANYSAIAGWESVSFGTIVCNIGDAEVDFVHNTNRHPIIGFNVYRLKTTSGVARFDQVGQGWLFHEFLALSNAQCCSDCQPTNGSTLGIHCSSPDSASITGQTARLGPRWQVNAFTGEFVMPFANPPVSGNQRRVEMRIEDIEPTAGGTRYFAEQFVIAPDDAQAGNGLNNATWREMAVTGSGSAWTFSLLGGSHPGEPILEAWRSARPDVELIEISVPDEGRFVLGVEVTPLEDGNYSYQYTLYNANSHRAARSVAIAARPITEVTQPEFRDVDYRGGDGENNTNVDGADWPFARTATEIRWDGPTYQQNANGNALRFGTAYRFGFVANAPPARGRLELGLFRLGSPDSVVVDVPAPRSFRVGDLNCDGTVNNFDIDAFVAALSDPAAYEAQYPDCDRMLADINADGLVNNFDIDLFVVCVANGGC
ncbi:MAG: hypothetical protein JNG88_11175 [Phycisphaerales bacterium]|nr:hypothetical protein [Phycisphaerales bacterium]